MVGPRRPSCRAPVRVEEFEGLFELAGLGEGSPLGVEFVRFADVILAPALVVLLEHVETGALVGEGGVLEEPQPGRAGNGLVVELAHVFYRVVALGLECGKLGSNELQRVVTIHILFLDHGLDDFAVLARPLQVRLARAASGQSGQRNHGQDQQRATGVSGRHGPQHFGIAILFNLFGHATRQVVVTKVIGQHHPAQPVGNQRRHLFALFERH